jgi:ArsR family transcriptional regulator, arsenate/arsenite/antimonite-responsive transcriptional repressor / arsenate reductase (thioredoxin)
MASPGQVAPPPFLRLAAHPVRWRLLSELAGSDLRVRELGALVHEPQNLVSYHLRLLREAGLVTARRSSADARDSYYRLDVDRCAHGLRSSGTALHPALVAAPSLAIWPDQARHLSPGSVLFACTGNSARSPMAEALLRDRSDNRIEVTSAGSHPKPGLHPYAVRAMREHYGIDIAKQRPRPFDISAGRRFDHVITLCDRVREGCPDIGDPSRRLHWSIADPAAAGDKADYSDFVRTAAEIDTRVRHLLITLALEEA